MTSNATSLDLSVIEAAGFREWKPVTSVTQVRRVFVTDEIRGLLDGTDKRGGFAPNAGTRLVERFLAGHLINVSRKIGKKRPDLEQIEGVDELWALCFRTLKPGWRIFGRFMHQDVLVLMSPVDRIDLGSISQYTATAKAIAKEWNDKFPMLEPLRAGTVGDYLTGVWRDLDDDD